MSLDDARYSVLRYLPSETENAYGPRIVDPRSGEIMESHICWYHNVMNLLKKWYMVQCGPLDKRAQSMTFDDKLMGTLIQFVSSHEVGHTLGLRHNMAASSATPVEKLRDKARWKPTVIRYQSWTMHDSIMWHSLKTGFQKRTFPSHWRL